MLLTCFSILFFKTILEGDSITLPFKWLQKFRDRLSDISIRDDKGFHSSLISTHLNPELDQVAHQVKIPAASPDGLSSVPNIPHGIRRELVPISCSRSLAVILVLSHDII